MARIERHPDSRPPVGRRYTPKEANPPGTHSVLGSLDKSVRLTGIDRKPLGAGKGAPVTNIGVGENNASRDALNDTPFTILLADDHPLVREGLLALINRQLDMRVIAEAQNGHEAVEKFFALRPDIALLDVRMAQMDGIETVRSILGKDPAAHIVILTSYQSEEDVYRALRAGARGFVVKDSPVEDIVECIRAVRAGGSWIPKGIAAKLARRVGERELTARESEVLRAIARGKSNKEIGSELNISEATVKVHVTHILEKLKASGRTEAMRLAVERGLVRMDASTAA